MMRMSWKKLIAQTCASFSWNSNANPHTPPHLKKKKKNNNNNNNNEGGGGGVCPICLDPLNFKCAIFRAQCSHAFHFSCISSNVGHGSVTCPICRAHWTQLPLPLLDHSRSSSPLPLHHHHHRLHISLLPTSPLLTPPHFPPQSSAAYHVCVRLRHPPPTDLVLVTSPGGLHMKQAMALVILSLRPQDRLSIVTHSARVFPLTHMTSYAKQTALQLIHRLFHFHIHVTSADPRLGLNKGIKVLDDRVYSNPQSHILHLSHNPQSYLEGVHCYHVCHCFAMHQFQEYLTGMLGRAVTEIQLKIDGRIIQLGELRGGEERKVPLLLPKSDQYCAEYSYIYTGGTNKVTGKMLIGVQSDTHHAETRESHHTIMAT